MPGTYRTPDERFEGLPGFPWEPHSRFLQEVAGEEIGARIVSWLPEESA